MDLDSRIAIVMCSIEICFSAEDLVEGVRMLASGVERTEAKPGCLSCAIAQDAKVGNRVHYVETWDAQGPFHRHVKSEEFWRVLVAMDMSCEGPRVLIGNFAGHSGLGCLRELRETDERGL